MPRLHEEAFMEHT